MSTFLGGSEVSGMYLGSNEIIEMYLGSNLFYSSEPIMGVEWDKQADSTMTRIGRSKNFVANIGIGNEIVRNDFDRAPIYQEIIRETDDLGNTFVRIPKFYIRKSNDENLFRLEISKEKIEGFYLPCFFWDFENNKELDYFYYGAYLGSLNSWKVESKPGVAPRVSMSLGEFRNYTKDNGSGYQQLDIHALDVIQTLFYVEFATLNSQSVHPGYTGGSNNKATGGTDGVVASSGAAGADDTYQFMYRGIEDLWGNVWQYVDGVNLNGYQAWVCEDATQYRGATFASPYQKLSYTNASSNGFVKEMGFDLARPYAQFPVTVGASETTYYSDNYYRSTGWREARFGGASRSWHGGLSAGISSWLMDSTSSSVDYVGGRLLKKPL